MKTDFLFHQPIEATEVPQTIVLPLQKNGSVPRLAGIEETSTISTTNVSNGDVPIEKFSPTYYDYHRNTLPLNGNGDLDSSNYDYIAQRRDSRYLRRPSGIPNLGNIEKRVGGSIGAPHRLPNGRRSGTVRERRNTPSDVKRRTAFMDNNINRYQERLRNTDISMEKAIETMPLSKYE